MLARKRLGLNNPSCRGKPGCNILRTLVPVTQTIPAHTRIPVILSPLSLSLSLSSILTAPITTIDDMPFDTIDEVQLSDVLSDLGMSGRSPVVFDTKTSNTSLMRKATEVVFPSLSLARLLTPTHGL
eukprot:TRINITY_DN4124_c0_g1_i1.p1 TRINITY_DN4124_c0_g1~~TRINITY_DN4124_c0_g1_i1.p1  ORF type:complete len:127 (+),score=19.27 TRINITY_DN4124_c0_g1_i1:80-460(+)